MISTSVTKLIQNERGLTLGEIMIALAINSIIVLAVVTMVSNAFLSGKTSENRQELATDFGLLQNYFARTIPNAGGMSIPTDAAFWVENDCSTKAPTSVFKDCDHSDRLTIASSDEGPVCKIVAYDNVTGIATLNTVTGPTGPICCMSARPLLGSQVLFINGYDYRQKWTQTADVGTCTAKFAPGPMAANDNVTSMTYDWTNGMIVPVHLDAFFLNSTDSTFNRYVYADAGSAVDEGTNQVLADRVLDFQVMLGYDFNPADGAVVDDGTTEDEWLYNATNEDIGHSPFTQSGVLMTKNTLRMIGVGWVIGTPGGGQGATTASVLNGPVRSKPNWILQSGLAKLGARSVYVFD